MWVHLVGIDFGFIHRIGLYGDDELIHAGALAATGRTVDG